MVSRVPLAPGYHIKIQAVMKRSTLTTNSLPIYLEAPLNLNVVSLPLVAIVVAIVGEILEWYITTVRRVATIVCFNIDDVALI